MDRVLKAAIVAGTISGAAATGASAAVVDERFDFFWSASNGSWVDSISQTQGAVTVNVAATTATDGHVLTGDTAKVQHWQNHGLGVWSSGDSSHQVDASGANDVALFSFDRAVTIKGIGFSYVDSGDMFDLYLGSTYDSTRSADDGGWGGTFYSFIGLSEGPLTSFAIGAAQYSVACSTTFRFSYSSGCSDFKSAFKIKYIDVSYDDTPPVVPLPAGAILMATALGGLGFARKRKS